MPSVQVTIHLPDALCHAVQTLAPQEGDANTVIIRALEEYITTTHKRRGRPRPGEYQKLVQALSMPVANLRLSARPATALRTLNINYVYERLQTSPVDLFRLPNFGEKSLREVKGKLAALGLSLGMTLDSGTYTTSVLQTIAMRVRAADGGELE